MAKIFLCHASEDKPQVREVYHHLKALGFDPWLDEQEILPGQDWDYEIEKALETSDFVMVFLSRYSVEKIGYVQRELRRALYRSEEMPEDYIHTIPVKLDDCEVPRRFRRHQWLNLYEDGAFDRMIRAIHHGLQQRGQSILKPPLRFDSPPAQVSTELKSSFFPAMPQVSQFTNSIGMELILIPAGTFIMGSPDSDSEAFDWEKPAHLVEITQPFYLGKYPVTQAQWEVVMGDNPSHFRGDPNRPVELVSWEDVDVFMQKLNEREADWIYCLPTEAQWEYACRSGTQESRYHEEIDKIAWYEANSNYQTHPVGQWLPNSWGLYDMLGNVYEWCYDGLLDYAGTSVIDPIGPTESGADRVVRGSGWLVSTRYVRSAYRKGLNPSFRSDDLGFRCLSLGTG